MGGHNNDGYAGVDVENIAVEKTIIVGMQAPNTFPNMKIDENGRSMPQLSVAENGGSQIAKGTGYECSCVDTSWLAHCGKYNVSAGNKISFNAGGGGIQMVTTGPLKSICNYIDLVSVFGMNFTTRLFTVTTTKRMELTGTRLDLNFDDTCIHGNINFLGNVHINGGMFVNGELVCRHLTTQGVENTTDLSDNLKGQIDPSQKFAIIGKTKAKGKGKATATIGNIISPHGTCSASNCPVTISNIELTELEFYFNNPTLEFHSKGFKDQSADVLIPAHQHSYIGPACHLPKSQADVVGEARKVTNSKEPVQSKKTFPNGMGSLEDFKDYICNTLQEHGKKWCKEWFGDKNPF